MNCGRRREGRAKDMYDRQYLQKHVGKIDNAYRYFLLIYDPSALLRLNGAVDLYSVPDETVQEWARRERGWAALSLPESVIIEAYLEKAYRQGILDKGGVVLGPRKSIFKGMRVCMFGAKKYGLTADWRKGVVLYEIRALPKTHLIRKAG